MHIPKCHHGTTSGKSAIGRINVNIHVLYDKSVTCVISLLSGVSK